MKIKIIKAALSNWYRERVGEEFEVLNKYNSDYYMLTNGKQTVLKSDAEVVEEVEKSCDNCDLLNKNNGCTLERGISCYGNKFKYWQPIESAEKSMRETADPKNIIKGSDYAKTRIDESIKKFEKDFINAVKQETAKQFTANTNKKHNDTIDTFINAVKSNKIKFNCQAEKQTGKFEIIGRELGELVDSKQQAYGDAITAVEQLMKVLYPMGVTVEQYRDMLLMVRIMDKQCRIAKGDKTAFGESPFRDIAGYGLLGVGHGN